MIGQNNPAHRANSVKKFMGRLLTATCLTAASAGAAHATTVNEPPDMGNTFALATALPAGTDVVTGHVGNGDADDYFVFSGLTPSAAFNVDFFTDGINGVVGGEVFTSGGASLGSGGFDVSTLDIAGTIPVNGTLVVHTFWQEGGDYVVTLSGVPEPATSTVAGLGVALLAGGLCIRRRKPNQ